MPGPPADLQLEPVDPAGARPPAPWWERGEFAWGAALGAGFVPTWIGIQIPLPGAAALLAVLGLAPLWIALLRRGKRPLLVWVALAWGLGCLSAAVGVVHEAALPQELHGRLPGAASLLIDLDPATGSAYRRGLLRDLGFALATLVLVAGPFARPGLLLCALYLQAMGGALGAGGFLPEASGLFVLSHVPPHAGLLAVGLLSCAAAVGEERGFRGLAGFSEPRKRHLWVGLGILGLALSLRGPLIEFWGARLAAAL